MCRCVLELSVDVISQLFLCTFYWFFFCLGRLNWIFNDYCRVQVNLFSVGLVEKVYNYFGSYNAWWAKVLLFYWHMWNFLMEFWYFETKKTKKFITFRPHKSYEIRASTRPTLNFYQRIFFASLRFPTAF